MMLAATRLRHLANTKWGARRYLDKKHSQGMDFEAATA